MSPLYLGEDAPGSLAAEPYAQVMAHVCIIQHLSDAKDLHIEVIYDNTAAADSFRGLCGASTGVDLVYFAVLCSLLVDKFSISYRHVESGEPWNELADSLCSFYLECYSAYLVEHPILSHEHGHILWDIPCSVCE